MSIAVRYTVTDEWIEELGTQAPYVENGLIRVTSASFFDLISNRAYLVAGYVVDGMLIEVRCEIGTWVREEQRPAIEKAYLAERAKIEAAADRLGLKLRAGWFTELAGGGRWT